jgi:hypothetical protein
MGYNAVYGQEVAPVLGIDTTAGAGGSIVSDNTVEKHRA